MDILLGIRTFVEFVLLTGVMFIITLACSSSALLVVNRFRLESYTGMAVWAVMAVLIPLWALRVFLKKRRAEAQQRRLLKQAEDIFNQEGSRRNDGGHARQDDYDDTDGYYRILGLRRGAPLSKIKEARKDLIRVWHPDRFANTRFFYKAQEKLKEINHAYDRVKDKFRNRK